MIHTPYPVVLDACVLYPSLLRDLLLRLGLKGLYQTKWTAAIQDEWQRNLLKNREDITTERIQRTAQLMNAALPDAMVTGYEKLIDSISLPDPGDCHVVAAAVRCNAEVIVTLNLKDFPGECLTQFDIESLHPDDFISDLFDLNHALALQAAAEQRASMRRPAKSVEEYLESLLRQGLPMTAKALDRYRAML